VTSLRLVPVTRDETTDFIRRVHRHHGRPQGYRYSVGVAADGVLVGVATAGRPVSRSLDHGDTIEVTRCCTDGHPNTCSMLYAACWRAARALGYARAITYTQAGESGASLRASGWRVDAVLDARGGWSMPSRPRRMAEHPTDVVRIRWIVGDGWPQDDELPITGRSLVAVETGYSDQQLDLFGGTR
jgi:hypothetical protein